jgi:Rha family phage regulatory protein
MTNLVVVQNGQAVTDSLTVAEVFGKRHDNVMKDIRNQINKLVLADEMDFTLLNFKERTFETEKGNLYNKFELTEDAFALIAMSYTTPEAMKMKVSFLKEFKRIKEELSKPKQLTEREQLAAVMKISFMQEEDIKHIKTEVENIREDLVKLDRSMTIDYGQALALNNAKNARVKYLWDNSIINKDVHETIRKVYAAAGRDLKNAFGVNSYHNILQKDFEEAMNFVKSWRPRLV